MPSSVNELMSTVTTKKGKRVSGLLELFDVDKGNERLCSKTHYNELSNPDVSQRLYAFDWCRQETTRRMQSDTMKPQSEKCSHRHTTGLLTFLKILSADDD